MRRIFAELRTRIVIIYRPAFLPLLEFLHASFIIILFKVKGSKYSAETVEPYHYNTECDLEYRSNTIKLKIEIVAGLLGRYYVSHVFLI